MNLEHTYDVCLYSVAYIMYESKDYIFLCIATFFLPVWGE
jgi:hypothetical protein